LIITLEGLTPKIHASCFIATSADLIGNVEIGEHSSVWFQTVLRGDILPIKIGARTNIQDQSILHTTPGGTPTIVGDDVTVGHRVILHGVHIKDRVLIGMGSTILDNVVVGEDSLIGAGSLVTKGMIIPSQSLVMGSPAKIIRSLKPEEIEMIRKSAEGYVKNSNRYK
jgi:carbonic anhydrase/acetyltransferase-like protein (isoleucine patch superfamily)